MAEKRYNPGHFLGIGIAIGMPAGLPLGMLIGFLIDNFVLGIAIGPVIGLIAGAMIGVHFEHEHRHLTHNRSAHHNHRRYFIMGAIFLIVLGIAATFYAFSSRRIPVESAQKTASEFISLMGTGQVLSTEFQGRFYESHINIYGDLVILYIDPFNRHIEGIDCPNGLYVSSEEFFMQGGNGTGCW